LAAFLPAAGFFTADLQLDGQCVLVLCHFSKLILVSSFSLSFSGFPFNGLSV
jgi:hypothetical protein